MTDDKENKKERANKYDDKVKFDGTFEDMIGISVKDAEKRVKERKEDGKKEDEQSGS